MTEIKKILIDSSIIPEKLLNGIYEIDLNSPNFNINKKLSFKTSKKIYTTRYIIPTVKIHPQIFTNSCRNQYDSFVNHLPKIG